MKKTLVLFLIGSALLGCSDSQMSKTEEQDFNKALATGKQKLDPDTLPPEVRDRVKGFMQSQKPPSSK